MAVLVNYNVVMRALRIAALVLSVSSLALAANPVPEIDPGSGVAAIALLSGCLLVFRASRKKT
jgi:hypothetical protein